MKPKYTCKSLIQFVKDGETFSGKIVEITLFRRENSIGYGVRSLDNTELLYIGEEQII